MNFKRINKQIILDKKYSDLCGIKYMSNVELDVCNYVISQLPTSINYSYKMGKIISTYELISRCIAEMNIFGNDIYDKIYKMSSKYEYIPNLKSHLSYSTIVQYSFSNFNKVDINSGKVVGFSVPCVFYDLSVYMLTHEYIHALKDINYEEHINMHLVGEVIPLFYELINIDKKNGENLLAIRFNELIDSKKSFVETSELIDINSGFFSKLLGKDEIYKYYRGVSGVYLNSFYYAVILYNMYKQNSKKILSMVSSVLKHEITTLDMLEQLGIYGDVRGSVFEKEVSKMKKRIK